MVSSRLRYRRSGGQPVSFRISECCCRHDPVRPALTLIGTIGQRCWELHRGAFACNTPEPQCTDMRIPTDQPPDVYVAVDMTCIGCGYNLRTLAVASACPECSRPIEDTRHLWFDPFDATDAERLLGSIGTLAWVPIFLFAGTVILGGLAWILGIVALLAPLLCMWFILGSGFFGASCGFIGSSGKLTRQRERFPPLVSMSLLSGAVVWVTFWIGEVSPAVFLFAILMMSLMAFTASHARRVANRTGARRIAAFARACHRTAILSCIACAACGIGFPIIGRPGAVSWVSRVVYAYWPVLLLVLVLPAVVGHSILMFRVKTWLSHFAKTRMDADRPR